MKRIFLFFTCGTILAVIVFLARPEPASYVGLVLSIPHWPARVLHWLGVGSLVHGFIVPPADWLLNLTGRHPLLHAVILCVLLLTAAVGVTISTEALRTSPSKRVILFLALPPLMILWFAFVSAWLAGMHLSRLSSFLEKRESGRAETFAVADLFIGAEPIDDNAARRTLRRLARISGDESLTGFDEANSGAVAKRQATLEESFHQLRRNIQQHTPRRQRAQALVFATSLELALQLQAAVLVPIANHGRGGNLDQTWREHRFQGPLGPITVRTNLLPPDPRLVPLLPGGLSEGMHQSATHIKQGAKGFADSGATLHFEHVDEIAQEFRLDDVVVRMWYTTLANYYITRGILESVIGSDRRVELADSDIYGELTVNLHNSCESYIRAVGEHAGDLAGLYRPDLNEVHVWLDERQYERLQARGLLDMAAATWASVDSLGKDSLLESEIVGAVAFATPTDRIAAVLTHELTHWSVRASLSNMPWLGLDESPAFGEGIALMLDNLPGEFTEEDLARVLSSVQPRLGAMIRRGRSSDLPTTQLYEPGKAGSCPAYVYQPINAACDWLTQTTHPTHSPRQLIALQPKRFFDSRNIKANYADAWALVRLFGSNILRQAASRHVSIQNVTVADPALSTPWWVIQNDIRTMSQGLPEDVSKVFGKCQR